MDEFRELQTKFNNLELQALTNNGFEIKGNLGFCAQVNGETIQTDFDIQGIISPDYPKVLPAIYESGRKLDNSFHVNPDDTLCLGTPLEKKIKFSDNPTLLGFFENLVIPFFIAYELFLKGYPVEQHEHGGKGILNYYCSIFGVSEPFTARAFLALLAKGKCCKKTTCPCGSRQRLRQCHGEIFRKILAYQTPEEFRYELDQTTLKSAK